MFKKWRTSKVTITADAANNDDNDSDAEDVTASGGAPVRGGLRFSHPSAKLEIELRNRPGVVVRPGEKLDLSLHVSSDLLRESKSVSVALVGKVRANIMGNPRYQAAQAMGPLGIGTNQSSAAPIVFGEVHTILDERRTVWQQSSSGESPEKIECSVAVPQDRNCGCTSGETALPSSIDDRLPGRDGSKELASTTSIRYSLRVRVKSKAALKRDVRLCIPLDLVGASSLPPGKVIATVSRFPLKYAAAGERRPPMLECQLAAVTPAGRGASIQYAVSYRIVTPVEDLPAYARDKRRGTSDACLPARYKAVSSPFFAQINASAQVGLFRQGTTRPVERVRDGQKCIFPGYELVKGIDAGESVGEAEGAGIGEIRGTVAVPRDEVSARSCGADVLHYLQMQLSTGVLDQLVVIKLDVFLPSD